MQRRVGEHQAKPLGARRDRGGDRRVGAAPGENDRALGRAQERLFLRRQLDQQLRAGSHHCERFLFAPLPLSEPGDRLLVGCVAGQVVTAQPLDRDDLSLAQERDGLPRLEREPGTAIRAAGRLGVEAAVGRILILAPAGLAHLERGHARVGAVVGDGADDREARSAVGAVDERVAEAPVLRIEKLAQAVVAGGDVGRH